MGWNDERAFNRLKSFCFPRLSGTKDLLNAREIIFNDLKRSINSTKIEEFRFHDELHRASTILGSMILALCIAKLLSWEYFPWLSAIFAVSLLLMFLLSFFNIGLRMTLWLYKNKGPIQGYNIIGELPAQKEEKQVLVVGAHYDTKSTTSLRNTFFPIMLFSTLLTTLVVIIYGIIRIFTGSSPVWFNIILYIAILWETFSIAFYLFYTKFGNESPGANDNGSGTAAVLELAEINSKNPPKYLTLLFVLFDAEELGTQGSAAFNTNYAKDLVKRGAWMINYDCTAGKKLTISLSGGVPVMHHGKKLRDVFETAIKNNSKLKDLVERKEILYDSYSIYPASDHMNCYFSGMPSASLGSADAGFGDPNYHSARDNLENFKKDTFQLGGEVVEEFIRLLDKNLEKV